MNITTAKAGILGFGLSVGFIFLNPGSNHEIFPYYVIFSIFFIRRIAHVSLVLFSLIGFLLYVLSFGFASYWLDALQAVSVILGLCTFASMTDREKLLFIQVLRFFLYLNFFVLLLQYVFPNFKFITYSLFSGRDPDLGVIAMSRNNAAPGMAPEPAYCAVYILGLWSMTHFIVQHPKRELYKDFAVLVISIFLLKSVYGFILLVAFVIFAAYNNYISRLVVTYISLLAVFFLVIFSNYLAGFDRITLFVSTFFNTFDFATAESAVSTYSTRFSDIVYSFEAQAGTTKSLSFGGFFATVFGYFAIPVVMMIVYIVRPLSAQYMFSLLMVLPFLFFVTPMLLWPAFAGLIFRRLPKG